jgi:hypothetical protein
MCNDLPIFGPSALSRLRARLTTLLVGIFILLIGSRLWFMLEPTLLIIKLVFLIEFARLLFALTHLVLIGVVGHLWLLSLLWSGSTTPGVNRSTMYL